MVQKIAPREIDTACTRQTATPAPSAHSASGSSRNGIASFSVVHAGIDVDAGETLTSIDLYNQP